MDEHSRLNNIYRGMKTRCVNKNRKDYVNYGDRGISVCDEWLCSDHKTHKGWLAFRDWALSNGYSDELTLDRIDNSKDYSPENCRWVSRKVQNNNRRDNHLVLYKGEVKSVAKWCADLNLNYNAVRCRILRGWSTEKAFETKVREVKK